MSQKVNTIVNRIFILTISGVIGVAVILAISDVLPPLPSQQVGAQPKLSEEAEMMKKLIETAEWESTTHDGCYFFSIRKGKRIEITTYSDGSITEITIDKHYVHTVFSKEDKAVLDKASKVVQERLALENARKRNDERKKMIRDLLEKEK
jgi:hypothetical protein